MPKTLCDWTKREIEKNAPELARLIARPRFYCRKCARAAAQKQVLCKPVQLPPQAGPDAAPQTANPAAEGPTNQPIF